MDRNFKSAGSNIRVIAMPALATGEARRSIDALIDQAIMASPVLLAHGLAYRETVLAVRGKPVGAQARLRESAKRAGDFLGDLARLSFRRNAFAHADRERLLGRNLAASEDDMRQYTPKYASSSMIRMSHHRASSMPPATAGPATAAITGLLSSSLDGPSGPGGSSPLPFSRNARVSAQAFALLADKALRSPPAQNAPWAP
jgi:hypothetical protein